MKHSEHPAFPDNKAKAITLLLAAFAGSIVLSMTVVVFLFKWLSES